MQTMTAQDRQTVNHAMGRIFGMKGCAMTTRELADHLSRSLLNKPLDCLPERAIPMSGERTQNDLIALVEFVCAKLKD